MVDYEQVYDDLTQAQKSISLFMKSECITETENSDRIKARQEEMTALIAENAEAGDYTQEFDERCRRIAEEINALKEEQAEAVRKKKLAENYEQRVK